MAKADLRANPAAIAQALEEAIGLFQQGRLDEAEKICARVLKARPGLVRRAASHGLVQAADRQGRRRLWAPQTGAQDQSGLVPMRWRISGWSSSALNRDAEALAALDKALALAPDDLPALNSRGIVLLKLDRAAEAVAAFERVLQRDPRMLAPAPTAAMRWRNSAASKRRSRNTTPCWRWPGARRNAFQSRQGAVESRPPARRDRGLRSRAGAAAGLRQGAHQSRHRAAGLQPASGTLPISARCWRSTRTTPTPTTTKGWRC